MMTTNAEASFVQRVRDAAEQLWLMSAWEHDQSLECEGWSTLYAIDADIFAMYGALESNARRTTDRPGYSEVFYDDPNAGSYALAERLVDYIFFDLQPNSPLLVIPPIDSEIRSILESLTLKLGREPSLEDVDEELIRSIIAEITQIDKSDPIPTEILERFSTLIALRGFNLQTEYRRLTNLLLLRKIIPSHSVQVEDNFPKNIMSVILHNDKIIDIYQHAKLSNDWLSRLESSHTSKVTSNRKRIKLNRDAEALARLEIWNNNLEKFNTRVLYITGAIHVINAAIMYEKEDISFFSKYIRHPRCFLASPKVVVRPEDVSISEKYKASQFFEWILTFLADCHLDEYVQDGFSIGLQLSEQLERIAKNAFKSDSTLGSELELKWRTYLEHLSASYVPPNEIIDQIKRDLNISRQIVALDDWRSFREKIDARIEEENDRAWDACFQTATKAGYFVGIASEDESKQIPSRLVPPLRFDRWPHTEEFVRFMSHWCNSNSDIVSQYEILLSEVRRETAGDFDYAYYLAHAALFAARGEWRVGAILAIRALSKASHPEPKNETTGHGREACYLAAYCLRHKARDLADLEEAETYLDKAISIHIKELGQAPKLVSLPERFESEKLALQMTKMLWHYYETDESKDNSKPTHDEWIQLRNKFMALSESLQMYNAENLDRQCNIRFVDCLSRLMARINANILMISILLEDYESIAFSNAGKELHLFISEANSSRSYYLNTIDMFWRVASGNNRPSRENVKKHFMELKISNHSVLTYDLSRYKDLNKKLEKLLKVKRL